MHTWFYTISVYNTWTKEGEETLNIFCDNFLKFKRFNIEIESIRLPKEKLMVHSFHLSPWNCQ